MPRLLITLLLSLLPALAMADINAPMRFALMQDCKDGTCEQVGLGVGEIHASSQKALEAFTAHYPGVKKIYLHSPGGDLGIALEMGIYLREHDFDTALTAKMRCLSACAYTFLGGVSRSIAQGGMIGVHRFYSRNGTGDLQEGQQAHSTLLQYTRAMGVSDTLLDMSVQAGQNEMIGVGVGRARVLRVDNSRPSPSNWKLIPQDGRLMAISEGFGAGWSDRTILLIDPVAKDGTQVVGFVLNTSAFTPDMEDALMSSAIALCNQKNTCIDGEVARDWEVVGDGRWVALFVFEEGGLQTLLDATGASELTASILLGTGREVRMPTDLDGLKTVMSGFAQRSSDN